MTKITDELIHEFKTKAFRERKLARQADGTYTLIEIWTNVPYEQYAETHKSRQEGGGYIPLAKRGRPKQQLTPEQEKQKEQERRAKRNEWNKTSQKRARDRAKARLTDGTEPGTEGMA